MFQEKFYWIILFVVLLGHSVIFAQTDWVPLESPNPKEMDATFRYKDHSLLIRACIPGFFREWVGEKNCYRLRVPGAGVVISPGRPQVPMFSYLFSLPSNSLVSVKFRCMEREVYANCPVLVNSSIIKTDGVYGVRKIEERERDCSNEQILRLRVKKIGKLQGRDILQITIIPFLADPSQHDLHVAKRFTVRIGFEGRREEKNSDLRMFSDGIIRFSSKNPEKREEIPSEYLIVTPKQFKQALQPLVDWRTAEGLLVTVKTISEIKKEMQITQPLSADKLKEYLSLYYNRQPNLTYVLLVGDVEFIPVKYKNGDGTDFYYSLLDGEGDLLPDIYLGRFPVNNCREISAIISKIKAHEKMKASKRVVFGSYFQDAGLDGISDRDYVYTSELFRSYLVKRKYVCRRVYLKTPGCKPTRYSNYSLVPSDICFDGKTQDVLNFINVGACIVNHRGHGTKDGWVNPCFQRKDISKLWNRRYPIMFNVDCATGQFDLETKSSECEIEGTPVSTKDESFSEQILTAENKGVVAIIAPSRITTKPLNNVFNQGLMGAIWPRMFKMNKSSATRLGQVLFRARIKLIREFGTNGWVSERLLGNFRRYHLLGDPALRIHQPQ